MIAREPPSSTNCPVASRATLAAYMAGELPPTVALMRLLMEGATPAALDALLERMIAALDDASAGGEAARLRDLRALSRAHPGAAATVASVLGVLAHDAPIRSEAEGLAYCRDGFDRAARISPEASVALYSLGDPELLAAATNELVTRLTEWGLLGPDRRVLDFGCGTGRVELALAPRVRSVIGLDLSGAMLAVAQRRCAGHPNVGFVQVPGDDLAAIADASVDVALAVDSFPYLVQSGLGLAERQLHELARVLAPGGDLVIANFSYRGDVERDRADLARLGGGAGFRVLRNGSRAFALWDGLAFHLARAR